MDLCENCSKRSEESHFSGDMTISLPRSLLTHQEPLGFIAKTPPTRPKTLHFKTDVMQRPKDIWDTNKNPSPNDSSQSDKVTFLSEESEPGTPSSHCSHDHTLGELDSKIRQFCLTNDPDLNEVRSPTFTKDIQELSDYMKKTLDDVKGSVHLLDTGREKGRYMNQKIKFSISKIERSLDEATLGLQDTKQLMNDVTEGNLALQQKLKRLRSSVASKENVMDDLRATLKSKPNKVTKTRAENKRSNDVKDVERASVSWDKELH